MTSTGKFLNVLVHWFRPSISKPLFFEFVLFQFLKVYFLQMVDPNERHEGSEDLRIPPLETTSESGQGPLPLSGPTEGRGEVGDIPLVETNSGHHEGEPPGTAPGNIWPTSSSDTEFTSTSESEIAMSEPSSPTKYTSESTDNEKLEGVNDLQLQDPPHYVGNEIISYAPMVQLPPEVWRSSGPFP